MRASAFALVIAVLAAGCATPDADPEPEPDPFEPPTLADYPPGAPAACPPHGTEQGLAFEWNAVTRFDERAGAENSVDVVRVDDEPARPAVLWVWRHVDPGERPDEVTRSGPWDLWRDAHGNLTLCGRVSLVAPTAERPPAPEPLTLHVLARPVEDLPPGNYTVIVNWRVGCPACGVEPEGHARGAFTVPGRP